MRSGWAMRVPFGFSAPRVAARCGRSVWQRLGASGSLQAADGRGAARRNERE